MIVNGKELAHDLILELQRKRANLTISPTLSIISIAPTFATKKYLQIKERAASAIGITLDVIECTVDVETADILKLIQEAAVSSNGIVLQLPYPPHIDVRELLSHIPSQLDVDVLGVERRVLYEKGDMSVLPPVVGAIDYIAQKFDISFLDKCVVIVGNGRLVGAPAAVYASQRGAQVTVLTKSSIEIERYSRDADILILGTGVPGLITSDMVKEGVVIFDAGTSEEDGKLAGDADIECQKKAALMTPVPGGIGPLTVAMLFANVLTLSQPAH